MEVDGRVVERLASRAGIPVSKVREMLEVLGEEHQTFRWPLTRFETELLLARGSDV